MSKSDLDAMDGVKGGVSYPPNLADAKEETPNGQTAYHAGQWTKEEKRGRADDGIRSRRNRQSQCRLKIGEIQSRSPLAPPFGCKARENE